MTETKANLCDDDAVDRIQHAFDRQPIPNPPRPPSRYNSVQRHQTGPEHPNVPIGRGRDLHWVASLLALAATVGIAIALFDLYPGAKVSDSSTEEEVGPPTPFANDANDTLDVVHVQDNVPSVSDPVTDPRFPAPSVGQPAQAAAKSKSLKVIASINDFLTRRSVQPDLLIEQLHQNYGYDPTALRSVFEKIGVPAGITSVKQGVNENQAWIVGKGHVAFRYGIRYPQILNDARRLIDGVLDESVTDEILNGIRDDLEGPQVDLRKDFFPLIGDRVILIVRAAPGPPSDSVIVVLPIKPKEATSAWSVVRQTHRVDPGSERDVYRGVEMQVVTRSDSPPVAWCMVESQLIIGHQPQVRAIVDRWKAKGAG